MPAKQSKKSGMKIAASKKSDKAVIVSEDTVRHVAASARLILTEAEVKKFQMDLNNILDAFRDLQKVDVKDIEPSFQPLPIKDVLRDDVLEPCLDHSKAMANTAHKEKGAFKGPRVV